MSAKPSMGQDAMLFTYVIASADMRHIERGEREIHLRYTLDTGPVVRGELPDCGPSCYADLGQVLLEYAMSCESCKDEVIEAEMAHGFGQRLGKVLSTKLRHDADEMGRLLTAIQCTLDSVDAPFTLEQADDKLHYVLETGPIDLAAENTGIGRGQPMARRSLITMCETLIQTLAPSWQLDSGGLNFDQPLSEIVIVKAS